MSAVGGRVLRSQTCSDVFQLGSRGCFAHPGQRSREYLHAVMGGAAVETRIGCFRSNRNIDALGMAKPKMELGRGYADYCVQSIVQVDCRSDYLGISAQLGLPKSVPKDRDCRRSGLVFGFSEEASQRWMHPRYRKEICGYL